jgi:hypothetical protein
VLQRRKVSPSNKANKARCCIAQSYQRRGDRHAGSREHERAQPRQRKRGTGVGFNAPGSNPRRSGLRV